jgi:DNA-binding PucR family transcriptional regulator
MLGALLDELRSRPAIRAGISAPYTRLARTPHALHLARLVLGTLQDGVGAIKQFAESPVGALLAAAPDTASELRKLVFGSMIELPQEDLETLLLTLSTWYDVGGSINDAAKHLYVHPNTIRYRLRRVQTQTGRSLDDPRDVADIRAALIAHDMIPHSAPQ